VDADRQLLYAQRTIADLSRKLSELNRQLAEAHARIAVLQAHNGRTNDPLSVSVEPAPLPPVIESPGDHNGPYHDVITDPLTGRIKEVRTGPLPPALTPRSLTPAAPATTDRLDRIEAQLRDLLNEVRDIRGNAATSPRTEHLAK